MYLYEKYGFSDAKRMLQEAYEEHYAIPSLNYIAIEQINAIGDAIIESNSPTIIMVAPKHCRQFEVQMLVRMAQAMIERIRDAGCLAPVALHLDHGNSFDDCKLAIDHGFSSVMIDGSGLCLEDNIKLTATVVKYAHLRGVTVEGEVGTLSGMEDQDDIGGIRQYTQPYEAELFIKKTDVDCLAVSVGTIHGLNKAGGNEQFMGLRLDLIAEIENRVPGFPLVLHGCSSLPQKYADMINRYAGRIEPTVGIPDECLKEASETAVCKINIASDGWIPSVAITRKILAEHADIIDSRLYREVIRKELTPIYRHKMDLFHSAGKGENFRISN